MSIENVTMIVAMIAAISSLISLYKTWQTWRKYKELERMADELYEAPRIKPISSHVVEFEITEVRNGKFVPPLHDDESE